MYNNSQQKNFFNLSKKFIKTASSDIEYDQLVQVLQFHEWKYYVDNSPILSDKEYDNLYQKLLEIESKSPGTIRNDSPSQRVSSDLTSNFQLVTHNSPMLSLDNSYNQEDLLEFDKQIRKLTQKNEDEQIQYFVEPKLDGGSIALVYENDHLVRAATRGNGAQGDDITLNAKALPSIPLSALFSKYGIEKAELRGEAVINKNVFELKNKERERDGKDIFANPRNAATGGLRMKDANESRKRGLEVFVFQMAFAIDKEGNDIMNDFETHDKVMSMLESLGFKIPKKEKQLAQDVRTAYTFAQSWEKNREAYDFEIDGAVVKVNAFELQKICGATQHHPRWAIAFKFKAKQATTTLLDVEYQIGKTGAITPVAKVEPVFLAGVTVSSISLHNQEFIQQKDLRINDKVIIERAGDVIPYVVKSLDELRDGTEQAIDFPTKCPSCNSELEKAEDQAAWRCQNPICPAQNMQRMIYHVSKDAMDIDGFGKSYVEKFIQLGWLNDVSDIYNLDYKAISNLEGFGQKSADKLKRSIEKAKKNPIHRLLNGLSIHHLGRKASKLIAQNIDNVFDLEQWTEENYVEIKDIGPVVAENVIQWFSFEENIAMLKKMNAHGVNISQTEEDRPQAIRVDAPLIGKTILFTGTLKQMGRKQAQTLAEENGAKNISAVSSNLNILVVGEKAGSKLKKAEALGTVEIYTEAEFLELIK